MQFKNISTQLARQGWLMNAMGGGVARTNIDVKHHDEGIELVIDTPSLSDTSYQLEVHQGTLVVYTSFGASDTELEGEKRNPTTVRKFPLMPQIAHDEIDAVFDDGKLHIYMPFLPGKPEAPRNIYIRKINDAKF